MSELESLEKLRKQLRDTFAKESVSILEDGNALMRCADEIEAEIERDYMRLPVDANNEPIHVGDEMFGDCPSGKHVSGCVTFIGENRFMLGNVQFYLRGDYMHHVKPRTLEDVLTEMLDRNSDGVGLREFNRDFGAFVAHYADEIRELLGSDGKC